MTKVVPVGILFLVTITTSVDDRPLHSLCPAENREYEPNSLFGNNLKHVLDTLAAKSKTKGSFITTSSRDGRDERVFGQALCRGDIPGRECQKCVRLAGQEIMKNCSRIDADIWYESCQVSYSFSNFFSTLQYLGKYADRNWEAKNVSDPGKFSLVLNSFMSHLAKKATGKSSGKKRFSVGSTNFSTNGTVYGLVQCSRGINREDCSTCLSNAFRDLVNSHSSLDSGILVSRFCNARFEIYKFYDYCSSEAGIKLEVILPVIFAVILAVGFLIACCFIYCRRRKMTAQDEERNHRALLQELANTIRDVAVAEDGDLVSSKELLFMDMTILKEATHNFSAGNMIGEGGFGKVYRGLLPDGREIAVKRLSRLSSQGIEEFKNEIVLIAKLKHRNLVSLIGWGIEGKEKLLVYEFMLNGSLDIFIFDREKSRELNWRMRYNIISGIARGLLYLHEGSRLKIIHRDLKPSNVLLDDEMAAKISDFGLARIFFDKQHNANTKRIVGTFGYMAPEYAMEGLFSLQSDVFSFGVILLEIISGKKNSGFDLANYAWILWRDKDEVKFIDPSLIASCSVTEVRRCLYVGLLCVQEDPEDRPAMTDVVVLLESGLESDSLPEPRRPLSKIGRGIPSNLFSSSSSHVYEYSRSPISPR